MGHCCTTQPNDHSSNSSTSTGLINRNGPNVQRPSNLELTAVNAISIAPKNEHTTQTDEETRYSPTTGRKRRRGYTGSSLGSAEMDYDEISMDEDIHIPPANFDESPTREIRKHLNALQFNHHAQQNQQDVGGTASNIPTKVPDLSEEERRQILNSHDFNRFFQQTTRVIERALAEDGDIFMDYINGPVHDDKQDKGELLCSTENSPRAKLL
uniref:Uncharacterized protein n=1 Tax=Ditylenchus dipsaci TaxID=166011 RepID=A0A915DX50_9BILA